MTPTTNNPARQQPEHEVRIGLIKAAIWKNENDGVVRYSVSFERLYHEGEEWRSTTAFGRDDLLLLAKVADRTHSWIVEAAEATPNARERRSARPGELSGNSMPARPFGA